TRRARSATAHDEARPGCVERFEDEGPRHVPVPSRARGPERKLCLRFDVVETAEHEGSRNLERKHLESILAIRRRRNDVTDCQLLKLRVNLASAAHPTVVEHVPGIEPPAPAPHLHEPGP